MTSKQWLAFALILLTAGPARSADYYFVVVLGSQQCRPRPNYSHTFAAFVHATAEGPCPDCFTIEDVHVISWLAANMVVRTRALCPEPGANFDLYSTMEWALGTCQRVSAWGPYQICEELYQRAVRREATLESGQVRYKALDSFRRTNRVSNCIHGVSATVAGNRVRILSPGFGETASYAVTRRMTPWIVDTAHRHLWISTALGLDQYPIIYRALENPRTGLFWHWLKCLTHAEQ